MWGQYFIQNDCADREGYYSVGADYLCEVDYHIPLEDNFSKNYLDFTTVPMNFFIVFICILLFKNSNISDKVKNYINYVSFVYFILNILIILIKIEFSDKELCNYPKSCHEGVNDTIIKSSYYYLKDSCSDELIYNLRPWTDINGDCMSSEYGCCEIHDLGCAQLTKEYTQYSRYINVLKEYHGHWFIDINKNDEAGSNCPTIEEIIYKVSKNKVDYGLYIPIMSLYIVIMIIIYMNKNKFNNYEETNNNDNELAPKDEIILVASA